MELDKALNDTETKPKCLEQLETMPSKVGSGKCTEKNGHLFCAKVDNDPQPFLPFMPTDEPEQPILNDLYQCLELLKCDKQTERVLSEKEWE